MRVLLVNPPDGRECAVRWSLPPVGLSFIAGALQQRGVDWRGFDLGPMELQDARMTIARIGSRFDFCGMTVFQENLHLALEITKEVKRRWVNCKVVWGGPFPTSAHQSILDRYPEVDFVVRGEGESAIHDVLSGRCKEQDVGVSYQENGRSFISRRTNRLQELASCPSPEWPNDRDSVTPDVFSVSEGEPVNPIPVSWSRGCGQHCDFCAVADIDRWRCRPVLRVVEEVRNRISGNRRNIVLFVDPNPISGGEQFLRLLQLLKNVGMDQFTCSARVDTVVKRRSLIEKMARLGWRWAEVGVESFDQESLDYYRKGFRAELIGECMGILQSLGVGIRLDFIMFHPERTAEGVLFNLEQLAQHGFREDLSPESLFSWLKPYHGTETRRRLEAEGRKWDPLHLPSYPETARSANAVHLFRRVQPLKERIGLLRSVGDRVEKLKNTFRVGIGHSRDDLRRMQEILLLFLVAKVTFFEAYRALALGDGSRLDEYDGVVLKLLSRVAQQSCGPGNLIDTFDYGDFVDNTESYQGKTVKMHLKYVGATGDCEKDLRSEVNGQISEEKAKPEYEFEKLFEEVDPYPCEDCARVKFSHYDPTFTIYFDVPEDVKVPKLGCEEHAVVTFKCHRGEFNYGNVVESITRLRVRSACQGQYPWEGTAR